MIIKELPSHWVTISQLDKQGDDRIVALHPDEQRELLEALARYLGATVTYSEAPTLPPESAWVVVPESPGSDEGRYNMLPCKLEPAKTALRQARKSEIFPGLPTITEAFQTAVENYSGQPAYIIDHGMPYTVVV